MIFERTNKNLEVISVQIILPSIQKQLLFKIHGDSSDTKNIILTNSGFLKIKRNRLIAVKDRLASNHIFICWILLRRPQTLWSCLIEFFTNWVITAKELFFVSPSNSAKKKFYSNEYSTEDLIKEI
jgi:hypothetical protein